MPEDQTDLHRLVWSPDDFEGEQLLTSAFRRADLRGGDNYVSVSRVDWLKPEAEIALAEAQASKADGAQFKREEAWSALLLSGSVRQATDEDGLNPFSVTPEPIVGVNEAHCGIRNTTGKAGKGYINQLRAILVEIVTSTSTLNEFLAKLNENKS